jgi:hypothetical protein
VQFASSPVLNAVKEGRVDLVVNLPTPASKNKRESYRRRCVIVYNATPLRADAVFNYHMRRAAVDYAVPLLTNLQVGCCCRILHIFALSKPLILQLLAMFADAMEKHTRNPMVRMHWRSRTRFVNDHGVFCYTGRPGAREPRNVLQG